MDVIIVDNLSLCLHKRLILSSVTARFGSSHITGIVGNNGSGKSMLLKCICGFIRPTQGRVLVQDINYTAMGKFPESIGFVIESPGFFGDMSGLENLWYLARIRNRITLNDVRKSILQVGLDPEDPKPVRKYSMGMKQRLGIAQAMMENPHILIFDEPMNGLDRGGIHEMRALFAQLGAAGKTIIITSHDPGDIDELCGSVYQMDAGVISLIQ